MTIATAGSDAFNNYLTKDQVTALADGNITAATPTMLVVNTNPGPVYTFSGTGLTYNASGALTGGTITGIKIRNQASINFATITGFSASATTFWSYVKADNAGALNLLMFSGNDTITGGSGNDSLTGGPGNDLMVGGTGNDTALLSSYDSYYFNSDGSVTVTGAQGTDTLKSIEFLGNLQIGTAGADMLTSSGHPVMAGGGDDIISIPDFQNVTVDGGGGSDTAQVTLDASGYDIGISIDGKISLVTNAYNDVDFHKTIFLQNVEYIQYFDTTVQVLFGATGAEGASGTSGAVPMAGGAGGGATTVAKATDLFANVINDEAVGGDGGIGGSATTANTAGAAGGHGGNASLSADNLTPPSAMILYATGGNGGQSGQGSGSGAAGAGGSGGDASIELSNDTIAAPFYAEADGGDGRASGSGGNASIQASDLSIGGNATMRAQGGVSASGQSGSSSVILDHITNTIGDIGLFQVYAGTAASITNSTFMYDGIDNNIDLSGHTLTFQNNSITGDSMQLGFTGDGAGSSLVFSGNSISAKHSSSSLGIFDSAGGTYMVNLVTGSLTVNGQANTISGFNSVSIDATTNSTITGNSAGNSLTGGSGDDILIGGLGNDTLDGGDDGVSDLDTAVVSRFDSLVFNSGFVTLTGPDGTDILRNIELVEETDLGKTIRIGTAGADSFTTNGYDVNAGPGDDTITIAAGQAITVDGGVGNDTVVLAGSSALYQIAPGIGVLAVSGNGENLTLANVEFLTFSDRTEQILHETVGANGTDQITDVNAHAAAPGGPGGNVTVAAPATDVIAGTGFINEAGLGGKGGKGAGGLNYHSGDGGAGGNATLTADNIALDATKTLAGISLTATGGDGGAAGPSFGSGGRGTNGAGGDASAEESHDTLTSSVTKQADLIAFATSGNGPAGSVGDASATLDHDAINLSASNAVVQLDAIARSNDDNASPVSIITNSTIGGGSAGSNLTVDVNMEGRLLTLQNDSITATTVNISLLSVTPAALFNFSGNSFIGQGNNATLAINDLSAAPDQPDTYIVNTTAGTLTVNGQTNSIAGFHTISITGNADVIYAGTNSGVTLTGGSGNDTLKGGAADDVLVGAGGNDTLQGNAGDDALYGDGGNDILIGSTGNDLMDGGVGTDIVKTTTAAGVVLAGADGNFTSWSAWGMDTLRSVEQLNFPGDTYYMLGTSGSDTLDSHGLGDQDQYDHGVALAGAGNDVITAGFNPDISLILDGGAGSDTASFAVTAASATVTTRGAVTTIAEGGAQVQLIHVESVAFSDQTVSVARPANPNGTFFDDGITEDLLWQNSDGSTEVWLMNGTAIIGTEQIASAASAAGKIVGTGLFNPTTKGSADIAWQNSSTGAVSVWDMNGNSTLSTTTVAAPAGWTLLGTGWFDGGASSSDLIFQEADGTIAVWLDAAGDGGVVAKPVKPLTYVASADFDGDGRSDILFQDNTGQLGIWFMDGATMLSKGAVQKTLGSASHVVATGDFNGDGKADILFQNSAGSISMWLMDGTAVTSSKVVGTPAAGWSVVAAADINGDGKSDIILQSTTGAVQAWIMNGTSVTSKTTIGTSPGSSWHIVAG